MNANTGARKMSQKEMIAEAKRIAGSPHDRRGSPYERVH
jgi:hypothetical protein